MGITGTLAVEVDIKSGGDVFHEIFSTRPHHVATMSPNIHGCDVHDGEFGKPGSVIFWEYTLLDGKKCVAKEIIEKIDEENKLVRFKIIEGDLLKEFKSFTLSVHVLPRGELTGVQWIAEFEKIDDSGPYPTKLMDFLISVTKDIEKHHLND
ncbi:hypothetical protein RND81_12G031400 [Saponaria officinalis]|uniref:Bet v I/Major latex protein domain-containing protein n=1 Tax=Saponaria officinalis TaxID=3572 RepID=A0AAW1H4J4_SAPOF